MIGMTTRPTTCPVLPSVRLDIRVTDKTGSNLDQSRARHELKGPFNFMVLSCHIIYMSKGRELLSASNHLVLFNLKFIESDLNNKFKLFNNFFIKKNLIG